MRNNCKEKIVKIIDGFNQLEAIKELISRGGRFLALKIKETNESGITQENFGAGTGNQSEGSGVQSNYSGQRKGV
jgi:hypothetical protein